MYLAHYMNCTLYLLIYDYKERKRNNYLIYDISLFLELTKYQIKEKWPLWSSGWGLLVILSLLSWETHMLALCLRAPCSLSWVSTWLCKDLKKKKDSKNVNLECQVKALPIWQMTMQYSVVVKLWKLVTGYLSLNASINSQLWTSVILLHLFLSHSIMYKIVIVTESIFYGCCVCKNITGYEVYRTLLGVE